MKRSNRASIVKRAWQIARKEARTGGGSPREYFGVGQRQARAERAERSDVLKRAWQIAKDMAAENGGRARDYFSDTQKQAWEEKKKPGRDEIVVPDASLPDMPYGSVLKGTELMHSASIGKSGTFWVVNAGKKEAWDGLSMKALQEWEDGDDYTVEDVMRQFSFLLAPGQSYVPEINHVVNTDAYLRFTAAGGDISELV